MMKIRPAELKDVSHLFLAQIEGYKHHDFLEPTALKEVEVDLTARIKSDEWMVYVGEKNGEIIASASYNLNWVHECAYACRIFGLEPETSTLILNNTIHQLPRDYVKKVFFRTFDDRTRVEYFQRMGWEKISANEIQEFHRMFKDIPLKSHRAYFVNKKPHS